MSMVGQRDPRTQQCVVAFFRDAIHPVLLIIMDAHFVRAIKIRRKLFQSW